MKLTVFYEHVREACRQSGKSLAEVAEILKANNIMGVEMDYMELTEELASELRACGVPIYNVYCHFDWGNQPAEDSENAEWVEVLKRLDRLDIHSMLVIPGFIQPGQDYEMMRINMLEGCKLLCKRAAKMGISVNMEDYDDSVAPYATYEGVRWFLDGVSELGCAFDTGNFLYSDENVLDAYEVLKDRITYVHCKDRSLAIKPGENPKATISGVDMYSASVGSGVIPMTELVNKIRALGYDGVWAIEHFGSQNQLSDIVKSAEYLNGFEV